MKQRSALFAVPLIISAGVVAIPAPASAQAPGYILTAKPAKRIEGVCTTDVTYPKFKASEWIVFSTAAPELPSQQKVSTKFSPEGKAGTEWWSIASSARALSTSRIGPVPPPAKP